MQVGLVGVPISMGIAIFAPPYDIDLLINRTLVYGTLTTTLVALYFGVIVLLQRVFVALTGERSTLACGLDPADSRPVQPLEATHPVVHRPSLLQTPGRR